MSVVAEHREMDWDVDWSFALPPGDQRPNALRELTASGLVEVCEECCRETTGTIFHSVPPATRQDIESALFEVAT